MDDPKDQLPPPSPRVYRITIVRPGANRVVLVTGYNAMTGAGTIVVEADRDDPAVVQMVGWIKPAAEVFTPDPDISGGPSAGGFPLTQVAATDRFRNTAAPITDVPTGSPAGVAKKLHVGGYRANNLLESSESRPFVAMPAEVATAVSAKHCLWLTYAEGLPIAAFAETTAAGGGYLPLAVAVPDEAASVRVEPIPGGSWRHDPAAATATGPDGRPGTEQHLDPAHAVKYRNATLRSSHITSAALRLNRLVALWDYDDWTLDTTELDCIATPTFPVTPAGGNRPLRLRLGFHDGYEWSNNDGVINVKVTWLPGP